MVCSLLRRDFGAAVTIDYIDVIEDDLDNYPEADDYLQKNGMHLPLVMIDGEPAWTGDFSYHKLRTELEKRGVKNGH